MRTLLSTAPVLRARAGSSAARRALQPLHPRFSAAYGTVRPGGLRRQPAAQASALHVPGYLVALLGKYLTYALLALSVDLIWGYMGVSAWGTGAFLPWAAMPSACTSCARRRARRVRQSGPAGFHGLS